MKRTMSGFVWLKELKHNYYRVFNNISELRLRYGEIPRKEIEEVEVTLAE